MLIFAILGFGIIVGFIAGWITGTQDWGKRILYGLLGSFVGGLLISLLSGDGLDLAPSGLLGSLGGAVLVTAGQRWWDRRSEPTAEQRAADVAARRSGDPRKRAR